MAAVLAEPISPELVLVCPELRERALAALPELPWPAPTVKTREQVPAPAEVPTWLLAWEITAYLAGSLVPFVVAMAGSVLVTLALTIVADATR
jgi:hypothetical protein